MSPTEKHEERARAEADRLDSGCAGWEVVCPDGRVRHWPYHNLDDAEAHAERASDLRWIARRGSCRLAPDMDELEASQPPCPGGRHETRPMLIVHLHRERGIS